ncbi:hypothetical protein CDL12_18274 [Handroanthus impetiginosus]|uniref:Uncharacterized protein n=1 Tax=Handroanthus impetiginosus TaxID=429701 RepID=A0A2G9GV32_9LAMI|nr:hypothetical protein CDL12_18274 [Handroanthus impetiginosus]
MGKTMVGGQPMDFVGVAQVEPVEETEENSLRQLDWPGEAHSRICTSKGVSKQTSRSKKRKIMDRTDDMLLGVILGFFSRASASIEKVANGLSYEIHASRRRASLYESIGKLPIRIDMNDRLKVSYFLAMNSKAMDMFFGLPDDAKIRMVQMALDGQLK